MKKFDIKSLLIGLVVGAIVVSAGFATTKTKSPTIKVANAVSTGEKVNSVTVSNSKVYFNGNEINLKKPLIEVKKEDNSEPQLYMPIDELLEYMQFKVEWNKKENAVNLTMKNQNINKSSENLTNMNMNEVDNKAIDIMQKTGNWGYVEPYFEHMSKEGIEKVVEIYNSKHINSSEHKKASDYIKNK